MVHSQPLPAPVVDAVDHRLRQHHVRQRAHLLRRGGTEGQRQRVSDAAMLSGLGLPRCVAPAPQLHQGEQARFTSLAPSFSRPLLFSPAHLDHVREADGPLVVDKEAGALQRVLAVGQRAKLQQVGEAQAVDLVPAVRVQLCLQRLRPAWRMVACVCVCVCVCVCGKVVWVWAKESARVGERRRKGPWLCLSCVLSLWPLTCACVLEWGSVELCDGFTERGRRRERAGQKRLGSRRRIEEGAPWVLQTPPVSSFPSSFQWAASAQRSAAEHSGQQWAIMRCSAP